MVAAVSLALTLTLLPAAVASAAPDHTATLNRANPKFTWESSGTGPHDPTSINGGPGMFRCTGGAFRCEYILLRVKTAGKLTLTLDSTDPVCGDGSTCHQRPVVGLQDIDGYLYWSNAAGEPLGRDLTNSDCGTGSASETCTVGLPRGFYVFEVEYLHAVNASYIGTAELSPVRRRPPPRRR